MKADRLFLNVLMLVLGALIPRGAIAQVRADGTLETQVQQGDGPQWVITGGSQVGGNLFHSFQTFSIPRGGEVWFNSSAAVARILSRVTGGSVSQLQGILRANGTADVFLLNPAGIVIGPDAQLVIGGSFVGTTAAAVQFADGSWFGTGAIAADLPPLLTQSAPVGLQFGATTGTIEVIGPGVKLGISPGMSPGMSPDLVPGSDLGTVPMARLDADALAAAIATEQQFLDNPAGLRVAPGQTIALLGGAVTISEGLFKAPSGRVVLASVDPGTSIPLTPTYELAPSLAPDPNPHGGPLALLNRTAISTSGDGLGQIQIWGGAVEIGDQVQLRSTTLTSTSLTSTSSTPTSSTPVTSTPTSLTPVTSTPVTSTPVTSTPTPLTSVTSTPTPLTSVTSTPTPLTSVASTPVTSTPATSTPVSASGSTSVLTPLTPSLSPVSAPGAIPLSASGSTPVLTSTLSPIPEARPAALAADPAISGGGIAIWADRLTLAPGSQLAVGTLGSGMGGRLSLEAGAIAATRSQLTANAFGTGSAGDVSLRAAGSLDLAETVVSSRTFGVGDGGALVLQGESVALRQGAQVDASTAGAGNAGAIQVAARDRLTLVGTGANGQRSGTFSTVDNLFATGSAGEISLQARQIDINTGARVDSGTAAVGDAGSVRLWAEDWVWIDGGTTPWRSPPSGVASGVLPAATGNAGDVQIQARAIAITRGAQVESPTSGPGQGGRVELVARDWIQIEGTAADPRDARSAVLTSSLDNSLGPGTGSAGDVVLRSPWVQVRNGAVIDSSTFERGNAGSVTVLADRLDLEAGRIRTTAEGDDPADAGNVTLRAGTIELTEGAQILADTNGRGGNVAIVAQTLVLRDRSRITANASGSFPGGNLTLELATLTALNNSDLTANARNSRGGRVNITAQGIFGPTYRDRLTPASDITATSSLGPSFSGTVQLNTPDLDPTTGLLTLPTTPVDIARLIRQDLCRQASASQFHRRGRGGLPNHPARWGETETTVVQAIAPVPTAPHRADPGRSTAAPATVAVPPNHRMDVDLEAIEPTTWVRTTTGHIQLIHQEGQGLSSTREATPNCD